MMIFALCAFSSAALAEKKQTGPTAPEEQQERQESCEDAGGSWNPDQSAEGGYCTCQDGAGGDEYDLPGTSTDGGGIEYDECGDPDAEPGPGIPVPGGTGVPTGPGAGIPGLPKKKKPCDWYDRMGCWGAAGVTGITIGICIGGTGAMGAGACVMVLPEILGTAGACKCIIQGGQEP